MLSIEKNWYLFRRCIYEIRWKFKMLSWLFSKQKKGDALTNNIFSIGVVTYVDRFEQFFKPLIKNLVTLFPDTAIIVALNGYHDQYIQQNYLREANIYLGQFSNIKVIQYSEPQSLSKLWNLVILNSSNEKAFILNDDLKISPGFRNDIYKSNILSSEISLINLSWSHFLISKQIIKQIGWFDERFPALGNEDEDYECRLELNGIQIKSVKIPGVKNIVFFSKNYSWENTELVNTKYALANQVFFNSKWDVSEKETAGFTYVRILEKYVRLKAGMETPEFYHLNL